MSIAILSAVAFALLTTSVSAQNTGYATYSNINGGVCSGVSSSLPVVSMNAAQFGGGAACGQCVQVQGTGNGAGSTPVSTAPYIAVINNVCPSCAAGDIDLQESGDGKFGITWSFVACPGTGRRLIEGGRKMIAEGSVPVEAGPSDEPILEASSEEVPQTIAPSLAESVAKEATLQAESHAEIPASQRSKSVPEEAPVTSREVAEEALEAGAPEAMLSSRRMLS